jgi:hypothetical protein
MMAEVWNMLDIKESDVGMLDLEDLVLHRPSRAHLITRCGLTMNQCKVGPVGALADLRMVCPECWRDAVIN